MITIEERDRVLVLKLNRDITNAFNFEHMTQLAGAIEKVRQDPNVDGMVLTSANDKIFSLGFDIPWLYRAAPEEVGRFYRFFNKVCLDLYTLPKPTVAAITGHAVAGGTIVTLCCDYRYIAGGRKLMGLNEIKLGVPVPYLPDCLLRELVGTRTARDIMETGEFYPAEALLKMGVVDELLPQEEVLSRAVAKAAELGLAPQAYRMIKQNRVESIEARILQHGEENDRAFLKVWFSDEAQKRIKEAIQKFQVKG